MRRWMVAGLILLTACGGTSTTAEVTTTTPTAAESEIVTTLPDWMYEPADGRPIGSPEGSVLVETSIGPIWVFDGMAYTKECDHDEKEIAAALIASGQQPNAGLSGFGRVCGGSGIPRP